MKRAKQWVIGAIFSCTECKREWQDYRTAARQAQRHAKSTGHRVTGEVTYAVKYEVAARQTTEGK